MSQKIVISKNHPFFLAQNEIRELSRPLLAPLGITYYTWSRHYKNGQGLFYTTHSDVIQYIFNIQLSIPAPSQPEIIKNKFHFVILPVGEHLKAQAEIKKIYNVGHFIAFVQQTDQYIDIQCFATDAKNESVINVYLNNLAPLEKFKSFFEDKANDLLKRGEQRRILFPEHFRPPYQRIFIPRDSQSSHYPLLAPYEHVKFTPRQSDCLHYLIQGCSLKETAYSLALSTRTIEHYLQHIKRKLNCKTKSELVSILLRHSNIY